MVQSGPVNREPRPPATSLENAADQAISSFQIGLDHARRPAASITVTRIQALSEKRAVFMDPRVSDVPSMDFAAVPAPLMMIRSAAEHSTWISFFSTTMS